MDPQEVQTFEDLLTEDQKEQKHRSWVMVLNNYTDETSAELIEFFSHGVTYACFAYEVGNSGTPHMQCYFSLTNAAKFTQVKKYFICQPHIVPARASAHYNRVYIQGPYTKYKDDKKGGVIEKHKPLNPTFREWGTLPAQGKRTDIDYVRTAHRKGMSMRDFSQSASGYQALKMYQLLQPYQRPARRTGMEVYWYYGPPGCGKTNDETIGAFAEAGWDAYSPAAGQLKWWDGYDGDAHVVIDELRDSHCSWSYLLSILDWKPMRVEVKGGTVCFTPKKIWITSCLSPLYIYPGVSEDRDQLYRRITRCEEFFLENKKYKRRVVKLV